MSLHGLESVAGAVRAGAEVGAEVLFVRREGKAHSCLALFLFFCYWLGFLVRLGVGMRYEVLRMSVKFSNRPGSSKVQCQRMDAGREAVKKKKKFKGEGRNSERFIL